MAISSFFIEIQKLIVEDLNDDANFENGAYLGVFKEMFKAERLKHRYSDWLEELKADYMTSHENNRFRILKEYYMSYHDWFYCQVFPGYCWEEEKVVFGRRGMAYCLKSKNELRFESEEKEMEFVEKYCALYVNYYCREHGEKVVCDYIIGFDKRLCKDLEGIAGRSVCDDKEIVSCDKFDDGVVLPPELDSERAVKLLERVIGKGFCDSHYKWLKSKALLAYFAERTSEDLNLGKGVYDKRSKISWKPFEDLFKIQGLSGARRDYQKTGTLPIGHKDVDNLFE